MCVVEGGRIGGGGKHERLLAWRGRYHDLYTRQHGLETNLFLAPGEGDPVEDNNGAKRAGGSAAPDAITLIRAVGTNLWAVFSSRALPGILSQILFTQTLSSSGRHTP